jgi:hypothetical protein
MTILGFLVVLATAAVPTGDGVTRFFLTTVTKSPTEGLSPDTMDCSGNEFLAGAVTTAASGLPLTEDTSSLYDLAVVLVAMAHERLPVVVRVIASSGHRC